jgi:3-isopropylmalate/(R)-2-methylmalate dehydratase small subunit
VVLSESVIGKLADTQIPSTLTVDLERCVLVSPDGIEYPFEIQAEARDMLLDGLDSVALTLKLDHRIVEFQQRDRIERPWVYDTPTVFSKMPL